MTWILLIVITLLPALGWFFLWRIQDQEREPWKAMTTCFVLGMLAPLMVFGLGYMFPGVFTLERSLWTIFCLALLEEVVKGLLLIVGIEIHEQWFTQIVDGLIYGSTIGLGFAFVENILYLIDFVTVDMSFVVVYLVRSLNTMLAHSLFVAFFGFFYASAYLRKEIFPEKKREKPWHHFFLNLWESLPLHVTMFHLLPNRPSKRGHYPGSLIFEGILLASLLHFIFNGLFEWEFYGMNWSFLTVPFVAMMGYGVWRMFLHEVYVRMVGK
ncbi:MAG: PrsW family glutamic-type intramembrane protease [Candidatus Gracilibacteria bacterium]|nr:PrsW family glutamic-type intramembrane protease [Candidatus Gracilibacteria bacterium]